MKKTIVIPIMGMVLAGLVFAVSCKKEKPDSDELDSEEIVLSDPEESSYVDLGLPSGTLWKNCNELDYYAHDDAIHTFGDSLPTKEQFEELVSVCHSEWDTVNKGRIFWGPNGNHIFLYAAGYRSFVGGMLWEDCVGSGGEYWSSTLCGEGNAWQLTFSMTGAGVSNYNKKCAFSIRLVKNNE